MSSGALQEQDDETVGFPDITEEELAFIRRVRRRAAQQDWVISFLESNPARFGS